MDNPQRVRWANVDWEQAKCIGHKNPDWFFDYEIARSGDNRNVKEQRKFCSDCPINLDCLDYALRVDVRGFWGGTTREERMRIRRQTGMEYQSLTFHNISKGVVGEDGREIRKSS